MKKICFVTAVPGTARVFLKNHINNLRKEYKVFLVSGSSDSDLLSELSLDGFKEIPISRKIDLKRDIQGLFKLREFFSLMDFDAVHSLTPKAGLLTSIAAKLARIPQRIHTFTGQVWATREGLSRWGLKMFDRLIVKLDNHILTDGFSQLHFLEKEKVLRVGDAQVLGGGSICGANTERFTPQDSIRKKSRTEIKVADSTVVFAFMGRINREKGIIELLSAFRRLLEDSPNAFLLLIGKDELGLSDIIKNYSVINDSNFLYYGFTRHPEEILQAADVYCLPSYREGFGMSVVEAQCLALPAICSDAYGLRDTIVDGRTGLRCKVADVESLYGCMKQLYDNKEMRLSFGQNGRMRVEQEFSSKVVEEAWLEFYHNILK